MIAVLKDLKDRAVDENPYHGRRNVRALRGELERLQDRAPAALFLKAGMAELNLGNTRSAIDDFTRARQLAYRDGADLAIRNDASFYLGVAYLRLGETQNCCERNTAESCILPIRGTGIHARQEGSRGAIPCFLEVLERTSDRDDRHLTARWLLNIAYMTLGQYPDDVPRRHLIPPDRFQPETSFPRFKNVAKQLGLDTFSLSGGAIVDDFDHDGCPDILASNWDTSGQIRYFRNNGDGTFADHTKQSGLSGLFGGLNLKQGDYNEDGFLDLLVLRGAWMHEDGRHPNSLVRNNGDGTFTDVTFDAGLGEVHYPTQTADWADFDNDGDLDLYVGNEHSPDTPFPCQLFRNNGNGTFTDIASQAGVENHRYTKGVTWGDYDDDQRIDLYVSNLGEPNRLYRNLGDGTFEDVAEELGVTGPLTSFPVWFWDYDNDGSQDLFVSSYNAGPGQVAAHYLGLPAEYDLPRLYKGNGQGRFEDMARAMKLTDPMLPMGSNFGDLNNDGYLDFYLGTGNPNVESLMPNLVYLNRQGAQFTNITIASGMGHLQKGHAVSFADVDRDGDLDVFVEMGGAYRGDEAFDCLYENPGFGNHWISIELVGTKSARSAIGARIRVEVDEAQQVRAIYRHVNSGGSFGANPFRQTFGLGKADCIRSVEILWPTGQTTRLDGRIEFDQAMTIVEGQSTSTMRW